MSLKLNTATSIFKGFNNPSGIFLCGYEWGGDPSNEAPDQDKLNNIPHTFSNKVPAYGDIARTWPYDKRIIKWFGLWGHPLSTQELGGDFEKTLIQTNWCDTQAINMEHVDVAKKLLDPPQIDNFIFHVKTLQPKIIFFFGIRQIDCLQRSQVFSRFEEIAGKCQKKLEFPKKPTNGIRFRVGFQKFENIQVIALPHPSGSRGVQDLYIASFKDEIGKILSDFKTSRNLND